VSARLFVSGDGTGDFFFLKTEHRDAGDWWREKIGCQKEFRKKKEPARKFHSSFFTAYIEIRKIIFRVRGISQKNIFGKIQMHTTDFPCQRDFRKIVFSKKKFLEPVVRVRKIFVQPL
jgi:hypothetical protein